MLCNTHMLVTIALSELSITVSREWRTLLSNRCKIEMHYPYHISRMQLSFVASPRHDFLDKTHLSQDVTLCFLFLSLKENWSDSVDTLRSLVSLILCWNKKEKQVRSFLHRNIPWVTNHDQAAVEKLEHTLAKLKAQRHSHWPQVPICLQQLHYQNYLSQFQGGERQFYQISV